MIFFFTNIENHENKFLIFLRDRSICRSSPNLKNEVLNKQTGPNYFFWTGPKGLAHSIEYYRVLWARIENFIQKPSIGALCFVLRNKGHQ